MDRVMHQNQNDLPAPPRIIFWLAIGIFVLIVLAGIGGIIYYTSGQRLGALIPYAAVVGALLPITAILLAVIFRKRLPRYFLPGMLILVIVLFAVGVFAAIFGYRELPPRYQEEVLSYAPFMRSLMRPTPAGGVVPTIASTSAISPEELLAMPIGGAAPTSPAAALLEQATDEPTAAPTIEPTAEATATVMPATIEPTAVSALPTDAPISTAEPVVNVESAVSRPPDARMYNFRHEQQQWNNCGPTNITMALSAYGWNQDQTFAASYIRPNQEDKNVSPHEMVAFVNEQTFVRAVWRIGGDMELIKDLIAQNFPVVIERSYTPEGYDWIGHYQTVVGYDDNLRTFYLYDSYLGTGANGEGVAESYDTFDNNWQHFNRTFIVVYEPSRETTVAQILGSRATPTGAAEYALETARAEASANPNDPFAWYNMGTAFLRLGMNDEAANAYDQSRRLGLPFRMIWYQFGIYEAYFNTGRYSDVLSISQTVINDSAGNIEEAYYWKARALAEQGDRAQAITALNSALRVNPLFADARDILDTLNA